MTSDIKNTYTGSLELKWDGKDESIILLNSDSSKSIVLPLQLA